MGCTRLVPGARFAPLMRGAFQIYRRHHATQVLGVVAWSAADQGGSMTFDWLITGHPASPSLPAQPMEQGIRRRHI